MVSNKKEVFENNLRRLYPNNERIFSYISKSRPQVFRVNTLKANVSDVLDSLTQQNIRFVNGPLENTYVVTTQDADLRLTKTKEFTGGLLYVQGLSSMLPVWSLGLDANDKVLDLCASPGSKTSLIAAMTNNKAQVTAVENNRNRFFALMKNLDNLNVSNVTYEMENGTRLGLVKPELTNYFDRVLVDVPCSNEAGINITDEKTISRWNPKASRHLSKLQKKLLLSGIRMLKPGGTLVYSTCTYTVEENESVVDWVVRKNNEIVLNDIHLNFSGLDVVSGFTEFEGKKFDSNLSKTMRVVPNDLFGGFYLAKMMKK
jgi:16S rRNA (cytosine1407-C5)-methyltransferase